jgi:hypothetical protein
MGLAIGQVFLTRLFISDQMIGASCSFYGDRKAVDGSQLIVIRIRTKPKSATPSRQRPVKAKLRATDTIDRALRGQNQGGSQASGSPAQATGDAYCGLWGPTGP